MASFENINIGSSIESRIKEVSRMCKILNDTKLKESTYTPWVRFEVGDLVIDTSDPKNQYFMSLEYNKNGSGSANSFTICIAYEPKPANLYGKMYDPSTIDKQIARASQGDEKLKCKLQYGYSLVDNNKLVSPVTEGQLLNYTTEIRDGLLFYTLTGVSTVVKTVDAKISVESKKDTKPTAAMKEVLEKYIVPLGYKINFEGNTENTDVTLSTIEEKSDISIWQYMDYLVSIAVPEGVDTEKEELANRPYYVYNIIEDSKEPSINIKLVDYSQNSDNTLFYTFNWMDRGNNMVLDFQTQFNGSVILAHQYIENELDESTYGIDELGKVVEVNRNSPAIVVDDTEGSVDKEANVEKYTWSQATQYSYKATLTLIGIPADIPITSYVYITPLIYGVAHHSKGKYLITKSSDRIDSGGFITTLELVKIATST